MERSKAQLRSGPDELSNNARTILKAIAEGRSYDQILAAGLAATYHDIFRAAAEALDVDERVKSGTSYEERMVAIRQAHPRAYEKWSTEEDRQLTGLFRSGSSVEHIGKALQRQPSAIRSRLAKLDVTQV